MSPTGTITIRDVAREAGVSITTVSRVLSRSALVASDTRRHVEQTIREMGFVANAHARALTGTSHPIIACLVPEMVSASFAELAGGIEAEATAAGHLLTLSTTHRDHDRERALINIACEQRAKAVVLVGADEGPDYRARMTTHHDALARTGTRLVLCGRPPLPDADAVGWVGYDDRGGAHAVTAHLIAQGHTRILVAGNNGSSTAAARLRGHREALRDAGLTVDEALSAPTAFSAAGGTAAVHEARRAGIEFSAVLGLADHIAIGALHALRSEGLRVPVDVALAGFDDIPFTTALTPPLTSVRIDFQSVGRRAARIGLGLEPMRSPVFPTQLMVRESTAPPSLSRPSRDLNQGVS